MIKRIKRRLWTVRRILVLKLRGRVRHSDRFGLSYWLWPDTRPLNTRGSQPRTDDIGVLEQLKRVYRAFDETDRGLVSVDVGAFIGVISLAMSRFGPSKHAIHSFEVDNLNYFRLKQNVSGVSGALVTTHNVAVADYVGSSHFTKYEDPGNNHLGTEMSATDVVSGVYEVPVTTLDSFAEQVGIEEIDVLKIDVEGFELDVLRGANRLLSGGRIRTMFIETQLSAEKRLEMQELLAASGFSTAYIVRNSTDLMPVSESNFSTSRVSPLNLLAVRNDLADQLISGS